MKKTTLIVLFAVLLFTTSTTSAQVALKELSLKEQIENANLVLEGRVISKKSFWSNHVIYTANTVEVYKTFKGQAPKTVDVLTLGGTVGLQALKVSSSLTLNIGDIGVFTLNHTATAQKSSTTKYKPHAAVQGFYKYNLYDDVAVNPFHTKQGITDSFYREIMTHTKSGFTETSVFNVKTIQSKLAQSKNTLAPSAIIFSPTSISAGTKSILTITIPPGNTGTGFGNTKGKVSFENADNGGLDYIDALNTQITSWSNTAITVEVPSNAGTGKVLVKNADNTMSVSNTNLIITFAEENVVYDPDDQTEIGGSNGALPARAYRVQHINENGNGGYTFQMNTRFDANTEAKAAFEKALESWRCTTRINWTLGPVTPVDEVTFESRQAQQAQSINIVRFDNGDELDNSILGQCYSWYKGCELSNGTFVWYVAEMDLVFNDNVNWNFGPQSTIQSSGNYDFESIALHELGHAHQLAHVIDTNPINDNSNDVMHYALQFKEDQRVLANINISAASGIQNRSTTTKVCNLPLMINYSASCTLGLDESTLKDIIEIYPNPTKGELFISSPSTITIKNIFIYDVSGRLMSKQNLPNQAPLHTLHLNNFTKGIYFIKIQSEATFITKKIILE